MSAPSLPVSPPPSALLSASGLKRTVTDRLLWQNLALEVRPGDRLMIMGPSGTGKSLMMRQLAGLDPLEAGDVIFGGRSQNDWAMPAYRAQVMYLPQQVSLPGGDDETVLDALKRPFGLKEHAGRSFDEAVAGHLLSRLGRTPQFLGQRAGRLSGGERQLVALTRALLLSPAVLLLDEATSALDPVTSTQAETLLREWSGQPVDHSADGRGQGRAWLAVSHDPGWRERLGTGQLNIENFQPKATQAYGEPA